MRMFCVKKLLQPIRDSNKVIDNRLKDLPALEIDRAKEILNLKEGASVDEIREAYENHSSL